jgi:predicted ester cyclase
MNDAFAAGDFAALTALFADDCMSVTPAGTFDNADHRAMIGAFLAAFPDAHHDVQRAVEAGDEVYLSGRFKGTHTGDLVGPNGTIPASGRPLDLPYIDYFRVVDGKIVAHEVIWDQVCLLGQIGALPSEQEAMTENRALVERCYQLAETAQYDRFPEVFNWDVELAMGGMNLRGVDQVRALIEAYAEAFPDMRYQVIDTVESGDTIAVKLLTKGTHTGVFRTPSGDVAPSGRAVVHQSVDWITVADGKIGSWLVYMDQLGFLTQLGLIPTPDAATK